MKHLLCDLLQACLPPEGRAWLEKALAATQPPVDANTLLGYYTGATRRAGKQLLTMTGEERARLAEMADARALDHWAGDDGARAALLLTVAEGLAPEPFAELALLCYEKGDSREQESWLRGLALLPEGERFVAAAVDACRTNIIPLFEAIACENPFPARFFPELSFNQLVMKVFFNGLAASRIRGLEGRLNPRLSRTCDDFVSEREAAGRSVPVDIWLVLAPYIGEDGLRRVHRYLAHEQAEHRYWAALGLGTLPDKAGAEVLAARREIEQDAKVKAAIEASLARTG